MLNLPDKVQRIEPENDKPIAQNTDEAATEDIIRIDKEQVIADWRLRNRNYYIALQVLCVFFGAVLIKFFEYLLK